MESLLYLLIALAGLGSLIVIIVLLRQIVRLLERLVGQNEIPEAPSNVVATIVLNRKVGGQDD